MISNSERHFINQWLEQRSGLRWKYYVQFTIAWTIVSFLIIFFLSKLFTNAWETGGQNLVFLLIAVSIIIGFLSTHFTYITNEKKYNKIMEREKNAKANETA